MINGCFRVCRTAGSYTFFSNVASASVFSRYNSYVLFFYCLYLSHLLMLVGVTTSLVIQHQPQPKVSLLFPTYRSVSYISANFMTRKLKMINAFQSLRIIFDIPSFSTLCQPFEKIYTNTFRIECFSVCPCQQYAIVPQLDSFL